MKSAEIDKINKTKDDIAKMEKNNEILIKDNQNLNQNNQIPNPPQINQQKNIINIPNNNLNPNEEEENEEEEGDDEEEKNEK